MPLDPVSTVHSLCALAASLFVWLNQLGEKEEALANLSRTVSRVCTVLAPFRGAQPTLEPILLEALLGLGDVLHRTEDHLRIWGGKRRGSGRTPLSRVVGFLAPAEITKTIRQDEQQLTQQLTVLLFAMATVSYFEKNTPGQSSDNHQISCPIKNRSVFKFWSDYLGAKTRWASSDRFIEALRKKFGDALSDEARQFLTLHIDEFHVGWVSLSTLDRFIRRESISSVIEHFMELEFASPSLRRKSSRDSLPPLLVWIDDNPTNNARFVAYARWLGIQVIELGSTALAKTWILENQDFLRVNDVPDRIRFISDNSRFECDPITEPGLDPYDNNMAGESIMRFLRGHSLHAPILIYCGDSIIDTHYVGTYHDAGSTCYFNVVYQYIKALAKGEYEDRGWVGYQSGNSKYLGRSLLVTSKFEP